jgi:trimeric autotransporter adhesin
MLIQKRLMQLGLTVIAVMGIGLMPMLAGSAAVGSIAGSRNATLSGEALVPNTTIFSGDTLQVKDGVAVVALDAGNRMVFGRETEASFLREAKNVTVMLSRGNVSMYHPGASVGVAVKAGDVTVSPAGGYKTLGEVAMLDGSLVVTAKQGTLEVERQGRTEQVAEGKTVRLPVTAAGPVPSPAAPPAGDAHITTATTLGVMAVGAGSAAAVLAGLGMSRSSDARDAANAATTAANNATTAANAATDAANAAAAAANAAGCAENNENPGMTPSPYTPPAGYSCP